MSGPSRARSDSPLVAFSHVALAAADLTGLIIASRVFDLWNRTTVPFVIVSWLLLSRGYTRQRRLVRSAGQDLNQVVSSVGAGTVTAALVAVRTPWVANSLLNAALLAAGLLLLSRVVIFGLVRVLRRAGKGAEPTIIVGAGPAAGRFARAVTRKKQLGLDIVGFVDHDACDDLPAPYLGEIERPAGAGRAPSGPPRHPRVLQDGRSRTGPPAAPVPRPARAVPLGVAARSSSNRPTPSPATSTATR